MLRQAQGIQPGGLCLAEEPVGVDSGEGKFFGQLPMSVKIQAQENNLLSYDSRVEASKAAVIHKKETARNSRSL